MKPQPPVTMMVCPAIRLAGASRRYRAIRTARRAAPDPRRHLFRHWQITMQAERFALQAAERCFEAQQQRAVERLSRTGMRKTSELNTSRKPRLPPYTSRTNSNCRA